MLALGMIAALAMPGTAQATPQLGDLGVKQSMSVKASNGESLEGKDLRAIQLATYTAASVDGNTIVGYDLTTNTALASDITAAAKAAGATDTNLTVNGKTISWLFGVNGDILASDASKAALPVGATITVTYKARLNGNAVIGSPCNVNSIDLEYSHNPNAWQDHNNQPGNEVKVCTGEIALRKVDAKSQKLTGAKFAIAQGASDKTPLKLVALGNGTYRLATSGDTTTTTTFEAGETKIQGLKGEYTITETQAPQDYSSLMLPSAVVTVNVDDTNMTWSLDVKSDPNNLIKKGDSHTVVVTNIRTITEIPLTGAAGLTMLFSIAALLFIGGIVMLRMCRSSND